MIGALTLNGKLLVGAIVAITLIGLIAGSAIGMNRVVTAIKADAFEAGVASSELTHRDALDKENAAHREREQGLQNDLVAFAKRNAELSAERRQREQVIVTRIEEALPAQPNCQITPELLALRNQIRNP